MDDITQDPSPSTILVDLDPYSDGFTILELASATAQLLGPGWTSGPRNWGTCGALTGPYETSFLFRVNDGVLFIEYRPDAADQFPVTQDLPDGMRPLRYGDGMWLEDPEPSEGLHALAARCSAAIRAVTGYDPADFDTTSSASRQHHIDTGRYLRKDEA